MNKFIIAALAVFAISGVASAGGLYVTVEGSRTATDVTGVDTDSVYGGGVGVGYNITDFFAVEGTWDYLGEDTYFGVDVEAKSYGGWAVLSPTIATIGGVAIKPMGRVGFVNTEISAAGASVNDTNLAYGLGVGFGVSENMDIIADWTQRTINGDSIGGGADDVDFDTYSLGVKYSF